MSWQEVVDDYCTKHNKERIDNSIVNLLHFSRCIKLANEQFVQWVRAI